MKTTLCLTVLIALVSGLPAVADGTLDSRVAYRLKSIDGLLKRAERALERGQATSARRTLVSIDRAWQQLARQYAGKYDPAHPDVVALTTRTDALRTRVVADPAPTARPPSGPSTTPGVKQPPRNDVTRAGHYLQRFEARVKSLGGRPFSLRDDEQRALALIKKLKTDYPDDPAVEALYQRARKAVLASEGGMMDITPAMLAYRQAETQLVERFAAVAATEWAALQKEIAATRIARPFPAPDVDETPLSALAGKYLVLEDFAYPANEFSCMGSQYVYVGDAARGMYYVQLSGRAWIGAYNALRRYRRQVAGALPQTLKWTLVGQVVDADMLVPQAGDKKTLGAVMGWLVKPVAIWVPGHTLTRVDLTRETAGRFAGEDRLAEIKGPMYSVTSVDPKATPEQLMRIYETAIKEKNYALFLKCIDPQRLQTPVALQRAAYHWDLHQHRFKTLIVAVKTVRQEVLVVSGVRASKTKDFFLNEKDKKKIARSADPLVERCTIWIQSFNERGKQQGKDKPVFLRRYGGEGNRWFIEHYATPF